MEGCIDAEVKAQVARLELPTGFYDRLLAEDDWSFVIKLNALVEAACTDALTARFHSPQLSKALSTLELGHPKHGKVALLSALNAIVPEQAGVLRLLLELRNMLAHNIGQVSFTFESYIAGMDKNQRNSFVTRAGHGIKPEVAGQSRHDFTLKNPKLALWLTMSEVLACLHLEHDVAANHLQTLALDALIGKN
jgi:hypothetical protein